MEVLHLLFRKKRFTDILKNKNPEKTDEISQTKAKIGKNYGDLQLQSRNDRNVLFLRQLWLKSTVEL